ncbi:MAG TPA: hypothetical protein VJ782_01530 [Aeromicrobium sp.]|nr:hypothetical protein [Aeromicrobium sp.]
MTKPLVTFAAPDKAARDYLRPLLVARPEAYAPNTVTAGFPVALTTGTHLQVELEGSNTDDYPVTERDQVRFTLWAPKGRPSDALDAASLVMAYVYAMSVPNVVAGAKVTLGRSDVTADPDTGYEMCWFLARLNMLATPLAS